MGGGVCQGGVCQRTCLPREGMIGVSAQGGVCQGVCVCQGGVCLGRGVCPGGGCTPPPLWTEFLTHACENITFPRLRTATIWSFVIQ